MVFICLCLGFCMNLLFDSVTHYSFVVIGNWIGVCLPNEWQSFIAAYTIFKRKYKHFFFHEWQMTLDTRWIIKPYFVIKCFELERRVFNSINYFEVDFIWWCGFFPAAASLSLSHFLTLHCKNRIEITWLIKIERLYNSFQINHCFYTTCQERKCWHQTKKNVMTSKKNLERIDNLLLEALHWLKRIASHQNSLDEFLN